MALVAYFEWEIYHIIGDKEYFTHYVGSSKGQMNIFESFELFFIKEFVEEIVTEINCFTKQFIKL